jgi:hypothetical protein
MKRALYLFLFLISFSCSSQYPPDMNIIRIEIKGVQSEYVLLSVRDSSLIVVDKPPEKKYIPPDHITDFARSIRFDEIDRMYYHHDASFDEILRPGIAGCGIGAGAGCATAGYAASDPNIYTYIAGGIAGSFIGTTLGVLIAVFVNSHEEQLFLDTKLHLDRVRDHAIFPGGEPAELQKIK